MSAQRTYLDWNASAPLLPEARVAMIAALERSGNPSSVHGEGRLARRAVEDAREAVAGLVGARADDVILTSGASEANATVIASGWDVISAPGIEHDSVLASIRASLAEWREVPVTAHGDVDLASIDAGGAAPARGLVSLQLANGETGVLQPVAEVARRLRARGWRVHCDATQAVGRMPVSVGDLGVDYLTFSSHKLGGPLGAGALVVREGAPLVALITGGGQERGRRSGTENVAAIAGFGAAARVAPERLERFLRLAGLRDRLEADLTRRAPGLVIHGHGRRRLSNVSSMAVPGRSAETLVAMLDLAGFAVSAGSACSSGKVGASHVLKAMGVADETARSSIRVSFGPETGEDALGAFASAFGKMTERWPAAA